MPKNQNSGDSPIAVDEEFQIDEDTGMGMYTYADKVKDRMENDIGVTTPNKPKVAPEHRGIFPHLKAGEYFDGRVPLVVRNLTLDQISDLHALLTAWYGYLIYQSRFIATEKSEAKAQRDFIASHLRTKWKRQKKGSDAAVKDFVLDDYRYVKWDATYEELHAAHTFLEAVLDNTKRDMNMVSREITIQQVKIEAGGIGNRTHNRAGRSIDPNAFTNPQEEQTQEPAADAEDSTRTSAPTKGKKGGGRKGVPYKLGRPKH